MTINTKIFKTSTFRLAAIYLLVFAVSAGAMLAYIFYNTVGLLERQTEETIRAEVQALGDQYRLLGLNGIVDVIGRRLQDQTGTIYMLESPDRQRVVGNLENMPQPEPASGTWVDFPITVGHGQAQVQHTARAYYAELSDGYELLVGRDVEELRSFRALILNALYWSLGLSLVMGLGGGYLISRNFLRRVDAITDASRGIMAGDLSQRMPVAGSGDELDRLASSLNEMLGQIERLMVGMKDMSGNVAHDLKTPLTRLRAKAEAALRTGKPEDHRVALQQTLAESDQLLTTFNALLSIARADAGNVREGFDDVDASEILSDVAELFEPLVEDAGGSLRYTADGPLIVHANRQLLSQAITNLLDNAMKYGADPASGKVTIAMAATANGKMVRISVADAGVGIPSEDRARVLERFVRLDQSRSKPGSGLGLSLVASVAKLHGGSFHLEDANPGLLAVVELPLQA